MRKNSGFTLIEIVIVITIIGILGVAVISILNPYEMQALGRDNVRLTEMSNTAQALELYFSEVKSYPNNNQNFRLDSNLLISLRNYNKSVRTADSATCNFLYRKNTSNYEIFAVMESKSLTLPPNSPFTIVLRSSVINSIGGTNTFGSMSPCSNSTNLIKYTKEF